MNSAKQGGLDLHQFENHLKIYFIFGKNCNISKYSCNFTAKPVILNSQTCNKTCNRGKTLKAVNNRALCCFAALADKYSGH